jgi:RNA polymerase sigma-70 factor (ECF subfamily)
MVSYVRPENPTAELLVAARTGDSAALEHLLATWLPVVLTWCKRLGGPRVDPQDAAQEILLVVVDRLDSVWSPDAFRPWLYGVTRRILDRHRRRAWVRRWVGSPDERIPDPIDPRLGAEQSETARRVQRAVHALTDEHREVLVLCDVEGYTDEEVAELLRVPVGTVKSRLRRARASFRTEADKAGLGPVVADMRSGS